MTRVQSVGMWKAASLQKVLESVREALKLSPTTNCKPYEYGTMPLMAAAASWHGEWDVRQLIAAGADVNATDNTNLKNTALHYAAMTNHDSLTVNALLALNADAFARNRDGLLPLDLARQYRREAVAAALMEHMKVHSGWLYVHGKLRWKKRWGVVLACNKQRTSTELCIFQHPNDIRPKAVLLVDESARASRIGHNDTIFGTDRKYAFTFDKPVMWQSAKRQKLTRSPICHKTISFEDVQIRNLVFAADNLHNLECWKQVLQSSNFYDHTNGNPLYCMPPQGANHNELYYWPHELFHGMQSPKSHRQELHEDSGVLTDRSSHQHSQAQISENDELLTDTTRSMNKSNIADGDSRLRIQQTPVEMDQPTQQSVLRKNEQIIKSESSMELIQMSSPIQRQHEKEVSTMCPTCHVRQSGAICTPCGHRYGCHNCLVKVTNTSQRCPFCRGRVRVVMRVNE
ncbi:putative Zinc finger, RING-type, PH-like domain superfamily, Zinc finger, RING/FYVE/PHD-type [Plasmopara halstedii]